MKRHKKSPAPGVTILSDGRYRVRVVIDPRTPQARDVTRTLPQGSTLGEAIDLRDRLRRGEVDEGQGAPSLTDYCERWIERRAARVRRSTAEGYARTMGNYVLPQLGHLRVDQLRRADLERYAAWLEGSGLAPRTQQQAWGRALMLVRDACADHRLHDPSARLRGPRGPEAPAGRALGADELRRVLDTAATLGQRSHVLLATLVWTGLRIGEVCAQRWEGIDLEGGWLTVTRSKTRAGHGRRVPLPEALLVLLRQWRTQAPGAWLLPGRDEARHLSARRASGLVAEISAASGVTLSAHDLRRTYATALARTGVDRVVLRSLVGHSHDAVTDLYVRPSDEDRRGAVRQVEGTLLGPAPNTRSQQG